VIVDFILRLLVLVNIWSILAISLNLQLGQTGLLSVAQAAFFGVGAYAVAILTKGQGWGFLPALLGAAGIAGLIGVFIAIPSLRLKGIYFLIASLGLQLVLYSLFQNWIDLTRGPMGYYGIPRPTILSWRVVTTGSFFLLTSAGLAFSGLLVWRIVSSPFGLVLRAIRDDDIVVEALGKSVTHYKVSVFVLGAILAAVAGGLYAAYLTAIDPVSFAIRESILMLAIVIIGGPGNVLLGSCLGVAVYMILPEILRFLNLSSTEVHQIRQIVFGILLVLIALYRPRGLVGEYELR